MSLRRLFFSLWYLLSKPPWDTGVAPPILEALVADDSIDPGRAIDIGCGTGTNALFLARHGWQVVGVDFAAPAIRAARRKQKAAAVDVAQRVVFRTGDAATLDGIDGPFDLAFDQGCLHSLSAEQRVGYAARLQQLVSPGGQYLLWAFKPEGGPPPGIAEADLLALFAPAFEATEIEPSTSGRAAAWYTLKRT